MTWSYRWLAFALTTLLLASAASLGRAQSPGVQVERWGLEQGLPQNSVNALAQTPDGYLWIATYGGLVRFNGYAFERADGPFARFARARVLSVAADGRDGLWVSVEDGGVWQAAAGQTRRVPVLPAVTPDLGPLHVYDGQAWFLMADRLAYERGAGRAFARFPAEVRGAPVSDFARDARGVVLITTGRGVYHLRGGRFEPLPGPAGALNTTTLYAEADGTRWYGTLTGLVRQTAAGRLEDFRASVPMPRVRVIRRDARGALLVGTHDGLYRFEGGRIAPETRVRVADGSVKSLLVDREGTVWFGTESDGLGRLRPHVARALDLPEGFGASGVTGLHRAPDGRAFVSGNCSGVAAAAPGEPLRVVPGTEEWCAWAVAATRTGDLWIGTWGHGLLRGTVRGVTRATGAADLPGSTVLGLYEDRAGRLWAADRAKGVFAWTPAGWRSVAPEARDVRFFYEDRAGRLWAGGGEGLYRREGGRFVRPAEAAVPVSVRSLHEDATGVLWVGTYGQGLLRVHGGRVDAVTEADGLPDAVVSSVTEDAAGALWLSHNRGVTRVGRRALAAYLDARRQGPAVPPLMRTFVAADGMPSTETNGGFQGAGLAFPDGRLWIPTIRGVAVFDPRQIARATAAPRAHIEEVQVDGVPRPRGGAAPRIAPGARRYTFRFVTLTSTGAEGLRYRVRLEGFDPGWVSLEGRREATYTNLRPGVYRFRVQGRSGDGAWQEAAPFAFRVAPHPWQTVPFWLLVAAGLGGGIVAFWRLRTRGLRRRQVELEQVVRARTSELKAANARLAAQRDALEVAASERAALVRTVSHDLKSPLAGIVGLADELALAFPEGSDDQALAGCIARSGQHLIDLVRDVLDTAAYERVRLDVAALARDVTAVQRVHAARKQQTLEVRGTRAAFILGDPLRFRAGLENLVGNALKFTPPGGHVEVAVAGTGETVVVTVDDSGPGLGGDEMATLFEPFVRGAARPTGGEASTGLGLSIVRDVVAAHGGRVEAGRSPLGGARFTLTVPAAPPAFLPETSPVGQATPAGVA